MLGCEAEVLLLLLRRHRREVAEYPRKELPLDSLRDLDELLLVQPGLIDLQIAVREAEDIFEDQLQIVLALELKVSRGAYLVGLVDFRVLREVEG